MRRSFNTSLVLAGLILVIAAPLGAAPATLTVEVDKPGHAISPMLYGIFFEDINCSADGGIYAEMVRNRNFEDSDKPDHWSVAASGPANCELSIDSAHPLGPKNLTRSGSALLTPAAVGPGSLIEPFGWTPHSPSPMPPWLWLCGRPTRPPPSRTLSRSRRLPRDRLRF